MGQCLICEESNQHSIAEKHAGNCKLLKFGKSIILE